MSEFTAGTLFLYDDLSAITEASCRRSVSLSGNERFFLVKHDIYRGQ